MKQAPFRYTFDALLRKRRSDWRTVKLEEITAARVVEHRDAEVTQTRDQVRETEYLLRQARRDGEPVDVFRERVLAAYLHHQRGMLVQRQQALEQARDVHERVRSNLEGIARGIKSLEKHRTQREADHRLLQQSIEQNRIDELWLLRQAGAAKAGADKYVECGTTAGGE
ncbi:MAG: hypothetical protein ACJ74E_12485 [Actinomycetes bacterium]